ncbi:MAG: hypothetical protein DRP62_08115, partial [Planctomycetota bacterium]
QALANFLGTVAEMSPYLLFGFLVAGILSVFISQRVVEKHLGGKGIWSLVKASLFGVPLPLCSCGLMTGPATNAASFVTIWKTLGSKTAITYLLTVASCALLSGILLDYIAAGVDFEVATRPAAMLPPLIKNASAIVVITILALGAISKKKNRN